ncbi:MAG: hypothetical protein K9K64_09080 [Desulfohalobiaceae bacterium]|nr:hypothetical protein [Desulfohalobiaceae bacterium]
MPCIPKENDVVYQELKTEITWLHGRWKIYRQLYGKSEKRIDLLNECAPVFFYIVQDVLLGDVLVALSKLTDQAASGRFDNLSLEQLQLQLEEYGDQDLSSQNRSILDQLHSKCEPFRTWRNKRLAHLDLNTHMESQYYPLPGISNQMIEDSLELVRRFMNNIEHHYNDSENAYEHFSMLGSDADSLVAMLRYGLRYEELIKEQKVDYDDWYQGKWHDA